MQECQELGAWVEQKLDVGDATLEVWVNGYNSELSRLLGGVQAANNSTAAMEDRPSKVLMGLSAEMPVRVAWQPANREVERLLHGKELPLPSAEGKS